MSAKKETDTNIPEASELDSGFISGPIDQLPFDSGLISGEISSEVKSDVKKVPIVQIECELDSGVVDITSELSSCSLEPQTLVPTLAVGTKSSVILPPLSVLFQQDDDGDTQLHIAAIHGCEKAISTLIKVCPNIEWFDVPNDNGHTALHLAVLSGNEVVTRMLVIAGASLAVRDRTGETPLHKATAAKNSSCIKALLEPVKEHPQRRHTAVLNQKNYSGQACIHVAASLGHVGTLQTLLYYGADITLKECRKFHAIHCQTQTVLKLLKNPADINENLAGWSALHIACARAHVEAARLLCARSPRVLPRARDFAGRTPRRLARRHAELRAALAPYDTASDSDSDSDDDEYDSDNDTESLFEKLQSSLNPRLVV